MNAGFAWEEAGGQHWEGASQHVLYLDGLDHECDTDSKMKFLNKRRLARLLDNESQAERITSAKTIFILWRE